MNNPSRALRIAEPSQPNPPQQQPASTSIQLPTPPTQSHRGRHAPLEPSEPVPLHPPTPTEASDAIKGPKKGLPINNAPTPPAAKRELSSIFVLGLPKVPTTSTRMALEGIADFFHEAKLEIYGRRNPRADDPMVMEICGLIQLLRTACEDGDKGERFRGRPSFWMEREGRNVDDELVASLDSMIDLGKTSRGCK